MNVLLLLSALLSALTGVGASVRQPQPAAAVVHQTRALATPVARAPAAQRPAIVPPKLAALAPVPEAAAPARPVAARLYLARLRV